MFGSEDKSNNENYFTIRKSNTEICSSLALVGYSVLTVLLFFLAAFRRIDN